MALEEELIASKAIFAGHVVYENMALPFREKVMIVAGKKHIAKEKGGW